LARHNQKKIFEEQDFSTGGQKARIFPIWSGLMEIKDHLLSRGSFRVQEGSQIRFWGDLWICYKPFMIRYPNLYGIVRKKHALVAEVVSTTPSKISFKRASLRELDFLA